MDQPIAELADRQQGVVAHRQLLALGYSPTAIQGRVGAGRLHPRYKGVYAVGRRNLDRKGHYMAAVLACGPDAVLSHRSAADLLGLRGTWQRRVDVMVPTHRRSRGPLRVHQSKTLSPEEIIEVEGIPVTGVERTIFDLASILDARRLTYVIEEAVRQQRFDLHRLERVIARNPRTRGLGRLHQVLADYRPAPDTRSKLERRFFEHLRTAGVPLPQVNVVVAGHTLDFFWADARLVLELDSRRYHLTPRAFETDRIRDADLLRADCRTLRISDKRYELEPDRVMDEVIAVRAACLRQLPA